MCQLIGTLRQWMGEHHENVRSFRRVVVPKTNLKFVWFNMEGLNAAKLYYHYVVVVVVVAEILFR